MSLPIDERRAGELDSDARALIIGHMKTKPDVEFSALGTVVDEIKNGDREVRDVMGT